MNESSVTELLAFLLCYITKTVGFFFVDKVLNDVIMSKNQLNTFCALYCPYPTIVDRDCCKNQRVGSGTHCSDLKCYMLFCKYPTKA